MRNYIPNEYTAFALVSLQTTAQGKIDISKDSRLAPIYNLLSVHPCSFRYTQVGSSFSFKVSLVLILDGVNRNLFQHAKNLFHKSVPILNWLGNRRIIIILCILAPMWAEWIKFCSVTAFLWTLMDLWTIARIYFAHAQMPRKGFGLKSDNLLPHFDQL